MSMKTLCTIQSTEISRCVYPLVVHINFHDFNLKRVFIDFKTYKDVAQGQSVSDSKQCQQWGGVRCYQSFFVLVELSTAHSVSFTSNTGFQLVSLSKRHLDKRGYNRLGFSYTQGLYKVKSHLVTLQLTATIWGMLLKCCTSRLNIYCHKGYI